MFNHKKPCVAIALAGVASGDLVAQEASKSVHALRGDNFQIEEIVVTARKRSENLQSIPLAIDVLGQQVLAEKGITNLENVAKYTPGLNFQTGILPNDTRVSIRGLTASRGRSNVAILVDGIDVSSESMTVGGGGSGANVNLMDLERVEVIKGPQSAVYGRSAFSGAVNYVTKRPGAKVEAEVEAEVAEGGLQKLGFAGSMPLVEDTLAASLNLTKSEFDGFYENPNTSGDLGGYDNEGVAVAFNFTPTDSFSAYWRSEYSEENYTPRAVVQRQAVSNVVTSPADYLLLGSVGDGAVNMPVPGGVFGGPQASAADCAGALPYAFLTGGPGCAPILVGNVGDAKESQVDLSPNPLTGKDYEGTEIRTLSHSLELSWDINDDINLLSLTGYSSNDTRVSEDFDLTNYTLLSAGPGSGAFVPSATNPFGPPPGYPGEYTQYGINSNSDTSYKSEQFSQELRITGTSDFMDWQVSALYWTEDMDTVMNQEWWLRDGADKTFWDAYLDDFAGGFGLVNHPTGPVPLPIPMGRETDHQSVAFALNIHLTESLRFNLEGRYLKEDIGYTSLPLDTQVNGLWGIPYIDPNTFMPGIPSTQTYSRTDEAFVPRASLDWQVTEDTLLYASYAEGFKPGGMSTTDGNGDISVGEYDPEELSVYEIGIKSMLLENRLQLNASAFYYEYTDQQVPYFVGTPSGALNVVVVNAGGSEMRGAELSAVYRPSQNWTFNAAYTYSDTEFTDFNVSEVGSPTTLDKLLSGNAQGDFSGNQFINSAKHSASLGIRYDGEFESGVGYFTELAGIYESERYLDLGNNAYLPAYWMVDFTAGVSFTSLDVTLYVKNLLDEDSVKSGITNISYGHLAGGSSTANSADLVVADPRQVGLRLTHHF